MRNKTHLWKRSLAALLCFVMVLGMLPAFGMAPVAYADEEITDDTNDNDGDTGLEAPGQQTNITGNYITLPITIRDYAADGMLFEYNEVNRYNLDDGPDTYTKTDRLYSHTGSPYTCYYNDSTMGSTEERSQGIFVMSYATNGTSLPDGFTGEWWYCLIVGQNGDILKVMRAGESKATYAADMDAEYTVNGAVVQPYYSVWAWRDAKNLPYYNLLAQVTEQNKDQYRVAVSSTTTDSTTTYQIYLGHRYYSNVNPTNISTVETDKHKGIYVIDGDQIASVLGSVEAFEKHTWWHCLVVDAYNGRNWVVKAIPNGVDKTGLTDYMDDTYKFVLVWSDGTNRAAYDTIAAITADNLDEYDIVTVSGTVFGSALFVERTISVNEADTRGFGLLMTGDYDYLDNLSATAGILSSELVSNNPNNNITDDNPKGIKVVNLWDENDKNNPYATQDVYGATIRTNLVAKELDEKTGKPRYTEDTVTYLATYMQALMAIPEKTDGAYNTHHVMGTKLFDESKQYVGPNSPLAVYDLADIFRMNVTGGLGDYDTAKAKFDTRGLLYAHQATTWYEAAYYLLHMLWYDSPVDDRTGTEGQDGYGMPIGRYNRIHLVETTNANGDITYVFNAKYDGTTYDYWNGEIFNSHFGEYNTETRPYSPAYTKYGNPYTVSGTNILPAARFDPLGIGGAKVDQGYTMAASPDTYGDFAKNNAMNWAEYYDETNYHMSLEGHAQFVYHEAANQYFTFTGDDDVYLYINGVRVLDVGGAHSIAKVSIDLNKVAKNCGLVDGGTYRFDFFFIERHGTAANFGIETNIQIADPAMNAYKTGYQNGANTGYNGAVDPNTHVGYSFELENHGDAKIYNLEFDDPAIGVHFGYNRIQYYPETYPENYPEDKKHLYTIDDLYLIYWNAEGKMVEYITPGSLDEESLMQYLANGLDEGERIGIYGFKYFIPQNQWVRVAGENADSFTNTVNVTANSSPDGTGHQLHGVADWKVHKMRVQFEPFHVYDWVNKDVSKDPAAVCNWRSPEKAGLPMGGVNVPKTKLVEYLTKAGVTLPDSLDDVTIVPCTASGNEDKHNQNPHVVLNESDGSITYYSDEKTGLDTVFYKVKWDGNEHNNVVFNYDVYTYGSVNNVYVLDYGLSVELAGDTFGFQNNDTVKIDNNLIAGADEENNNVMGAPVVTGIVDANGDDITTKVGTYGDFAWDADTKSLKYTPDAIINNTDEVYAKFRIMEKDAMAKGEEPSIYNSVEMVQKVTTAPANVVYYEENFPGITYVNQGENQWVHYETVDEDGNSVAGTEQSADQDMNYGSDDNYAEDKVGVLESDGPVVNTINLNLDTSDLNALQASGIEALNEYFGLGGGDSNGTVNKLEVKQTAEVMYFDFTGTGFELISRTTMEEYAVINVQVQRDSDGDGTYDTVETQLPVITESKGGDLYQIPIISITGLTKDTYRVVVYAGTTGNVNRVFYVDGIRIYGPLDNDQALEYYNPAEYQAEFFEVKQMIENGQMIYADLDYNDETVLGFITGTTMVEDTETGAILVAVDDVNKYMSVGPNNELYMDGNGNVSVLSFILTPEADYPGAARTLQIGVHRKANSNIDDIQGSALLSYATDPMDIYNAMNGYLDGIIPETNAYLISSGTEMYYTIELDNLTPRADGSYLIMVAAVGTEFNDTNLALTNFKVAGYTVSYAQPAIQTAAAEGTVDELPIVAQTFSLLRAVRELAAKEPEVEQIPVNENLTINSAALSAAKVVSGRTVTLTVKAGADAEKIVVLDAQGNEVTATRCTSKLSRDVVTFTFTYKVTGTSGQSLNYTVRVYDANDLASVNTETVTVTIR